MALPCISHELQAATTMPPVRTCRVTNTQWRRGAQQVFPHNVSKFLRLFEGDRPNPARISVPILVFMVLWGLQHRSGLIWMFTGKCSHLVVRRRRSPSYLGRRGASLPSSFIPLPFLSPPGLASFARPWCQLNIVAVAQPISASPGLSSCTTSRASIIIPVRSRAAPAADSCFSTAVRIIALLWLPVHTTYVV